MVMPENIRIIEQSRMVALRSIDDVKKAGIGLADSCVEHSLTAVMVNKIGLPLRGQRWIYTRLPV